MNILSASPSAVRLDTSLTVNEVLARYPRTAPVLNAFGIDTCCGGGRSLAEAAQADGCAVDTLVAALGDAIARG